MRHASLVVYLAKKYATSSVPVGELVSAGYDGLERAVQKFRMINSQSFTGYAHRAIRNRTITHLRVVHRRAWVDIPFLEETIASPDSTESSYNLYSRREKARELLKESIENALDNAEADLVHRLFFSETEEKQRDIARSYGVNQPGDLKAKSKGAHETPRLF